MVRLECARPTCTRRAQTAGLCKQHYWAATRNVPTGLVDAAPVRAHIKALADAGISGKRLGALIGSSQTSIWRIGRQEKVLASTAAKIMAIQLPQRPFDIAADSAMTPVIGTRRRLQALQVAGYTTAYLASRLSVQRRAVVEIMSQEYVTAKVAREVADLFDELQLIPGPNVVTRNRSLRKGWVPALAWDEDSIDDPAAKPHKPTNPFRRLSAEEFLEEYEDFRLRGLSNKEIAEHMGIRYDSLQTRLRRYQQKENVA